MKGIAFSRCLEKSEANDDQVLQGESSKGYHDDDVRGLE